MTGLLRWYEQADANNGIIISSKVRLARNFSKYNFSLKLSEEASAKMIHEAVKELNGLKEFASFLEYDFKDLDDTQKIALRERHCISDFLLQQKQAAGFISPKEDISVMLNEEDHIRIQAYSAGNDLKSAYKKASEIDDVIGSAVHYAYDYKYGYLTICPSNAGTGMRASVMLHLPMLAAAGGIDSLASEVGRFQMKLKSVGGTGKYSIGDMYRISNLVTLGVSEKQILENLKAIAEMVAKQEAEIQKEYIDSMPVRARDTVYRAYGVLKYARSIDLKDALTLLSEIRFGILNGLVKPVKKTAAIYPIMIGASPANLCLEAVETLTEEEINTARADFIRKNLPEIEN